MDPAMRQVAKERPAVVLLHASASTARQWDALVERLQPRYRPIAVELRGKDDAALVAATLERLGGAHVVGHSYGGAVGMMVASSRRSPLVRSLTAFEPVLLRALLADPASGREIQDVALVAANMRSHLDRGERQRAAQLFIEYWSGPDSWRSLPPNRRAAFAMRVEEVLANFDTLFHTPFDAPALARLRRPMLFLQGARTVATTRRLAMLLGDAFPAARHEVMTEMGHMGPLTHAERVNERIEQFLDWCEAGARRPVVFVGPRHRAAGGTH